MSMSSEIRVSDIPKQEVLMHDLEMWRGRKEFAEQQIERIKSELGARVVGHLIVIEGGRSVSHQGE